MNKRFLFLAIVIAGGYSFLFFRLYGIQLSKGDYYLARAQSQYLASGLIAARRGTIYFSDKNGNKLAVAVEKNFPMIYAVPKIIDDAKETYNRLLQILPDISPNLEKKLSVKSNSYVLLERKAHQSVVDKIVQENIKGVFSDLEPERFYPFGSLASHVLGFVGPNSGDNGESGKYGLEKFYESFLNGIPGKTEDGKLIQPQNGEDLILTIDPNIQKQAETLLKNLVVTNRAKAGAFIV